MKTVQANDKALIATGLTEILSHGKIAGFEVFWQFGKPALNYKSKTQEIDFNGVKHTAHTVLSTDNWNGITYAWKSVDKTNGDKHQFTKAKKLEQGLHAGNLGLLKDGTLVHVLAEEDAKNTKKETTKPSF